MSEPIRYDYEQAKLNKTAGFYVRKEGHWVKWDDYANLNAENERLKGIILAQPSDFVRSKTDKADISKHPIMGPAWDERQKQQE